MFENPVENTWLKSPSVRSNLLFTVSIFTKKEKKCHKNNKSVEIVDKRIKVWNYCWQRSGASNNCQWEREREREAFSKFTFEFWNFQSVLLAIIPKFEQTKAFPFSGLVEHLQTPGRANWLMNILEMKFSISLDL